MQIFFKLFTLLVLKQHALPLILQSVLLVCEFDRICLCGKLSGLGFTPQVLQRHIVSILVCKFLMRQWTQKVRFTLSAFLFNSYYLVMCNISERRCKRILAMMTVQTPLIKSIAVVEVL